MALFIDTSVWSHAFRRDPPGSSPQVERLRAALKNEEIVLTTGIVLQELLQGLSGPRARAQLIETFRALPFLNPTREDHVAAAELRNHCRRKGVQAGTIDVLLAQLCITSGAEMLTLDGDFSFIAKHSALRIWRG